MDDLVITEQQYGDALHAVLAHQDEIREQLAENDRAWIVDKLKLTPIHDLPEMRYLLNLIHSALQATGDVWGLAEYSTTWPKPQTRG